MMKSPAIAFVLCAALVAPAAASPIILGDMVVDSASLLITVSETEEGYDVSVRSAGPEVVYSCAGEKSDHMKEDLLASSAKLAKTSKFDLGPLMEHYHLECTRRETPPPEEPPQPTAGS